MRGLKAKCRVGVLALVFLCLVLAALHHLLKPIPNGCSMTYMYPTYIPISTPVDVSSEKYGLFLYHEGWQKIDFVEHLKKLNGVPVLFIPGNGGSYKQVRSLASESSRAYQGGPFEPSFYQEALLEHDLLEEISVPEDLYSFAVPGHYSHMLDWFAVDLEGEHSAMDGQILEEHTEYVVYAIHRFVIGAGFRVPVSKNQHTDFVINQLGVHLQILDQYQESRQSQIKDGGFSGSLPTSVILVGHSMGGFVARAAVVHPNLRTSAVETILTLSSPHRSPPIALQPSLGHFFSDVNEQWKNGYKIQVSPGQFASPAKLSRVIVVSIFGGIYDYQVRSELASLDGIVPSTHGFTIGTSGMKGVWLSMEHQSILWCNQLVVQISHTLLSMINPENGQPYSSTEKRLIVFKKMLQSGIPQSLNWPSRIQPSIASRSIPVNIAKRARESLQQNYFSCPASAHWNDDGLEKDLYIESTSVTVLAMDGKRRWLDIGKLNSTGRGHFIFVTNLAPCSGVRLHLWPEKSKALMDDGMTASKRIMEVTTKMVQIPAGPAPRQIEPGSQTEQAPPSGFLRLSSEEMSGFRFLTISIASRPSVSGRPPPAASMAVGQFFNPEEGTRKFSSTTLLRSSYIKEVFSLKEGHPLALNLSFSISLGLLPVTLSLNTTGCGINSAAEQTGSADQSRLCKLRCFPPAAFAWDMTSGLHVIPNIYTETMIVDSSPAMSETRPEYEKTIMLLLVDPHCSYNLSISVSPTAAGSRFFLSYSSQIVGSMVAATFFALMRQARAWELDTSIPSVLSAVELNLRMPSPFLFLAVAPIFASLLFDMLFSQQLPPVGSRICLSILCYLVANGFLIILILISELVLYAAATTHLFTKKRFLAWGGRFLIAPFERVFTFSSLFSLKILRTSPSFVVAFVAILLVCLVHPALGLTLLLFAHTFHGHTALCSYLAASFRSHSQRKGNPGSEIKSRSSSSPRTKGSNGYDSLLPLDDGYSTSPNSAKSFSDSQLELFNYRHGILILHLLALLMFVPSLIAWLQRIGMGQSLPWFADSALSAGVILHGLCGSTPDIHALASSLPRSIYGREVGLSIVYLIAGYYTFFSALTSTPYRALNAMAVVGIVSSVSKVIERRNREKGEFNNRVRRRHPHRH